MVALLKPPIKIPVRVQGAGTLPCPLGHLMPELTLLSIYRSEWLEAVFLGDSFNSWGFKL